MIPHRFSRLPRIAPLNRIENAAYPRLVKGLQLVDQSAEPLDIVASQLDLMISGIPAHVIADRYLVMGAQPYPVFEQVMAKVGASPRTSAES